MASFKQIFMISLVLFLSACGNQEDSNSDVNKDKDSLVQTDTSSPLKSDKIEMDENTPIWTYDYNADTIIQVRTVKKDVLTPEKLISIINSEFQDKVKLDFVKIAHDTIFVKIDKSEYLTQQMGSAGAYGYMITATFNLTELPNVKYVNFDFKVGDHATPGTYGRKYFFDQIKRNKESNLK